MSRVEERRRAASTPFGAPLSRGRNRHGDPFKEVCHSVIPLSDDAPKGRFAWVTLILLLGNVAVFLAQHYGAARDPAQWYFRLGCIPYEISRLVDIGPTELVPVPFTLFTSLFLHGGWIHLAANMLFLWIFGDNVEARLGHGRYALFYIACGVVAAGVQVAIHPGSRTPIVGASGAIAAIMAAYLVFYPHARVKTLVFWFVFVQVVRIPAVVFLGYWIAVQLLAGLALQGHGTDGVAWFAHVGGFAAGLCVAFALRSRRRGGRKRKPK